MDPEDEISETVADVVSDHIESAQESANRHAEVALELAAAAMETERGREIIDLNERLSECRLILDQLPAMLADQFSQTLSTLRAEVTAEIQTMRAEMAESLAVALASLTAEQAPLELTPPILAAETVEPETLPPPTESADAPPVAPRKRRFL